MNEFVCDDCGNEFTTPDDFTVCPECGSDRVEKTYLDEEDSV